MQVHIDQSFLSQLEAASRQLGGLSVLPPSFAAGEEVLTQAQFAERFSARWRVVQDLSNHTSAEELARITTRIRGLNAFDDYVVRHERQELEILREGQLPWVQALRDTLESGIQTGFTEMTMGSGKGFTMVEAIRLLGGRNLVLEPSRPLIRKLRSDLKTQAPDLEIGGTAALKRGDLPRDVATCTYHFFLRQMESGATWWKGFDRVWLDEGHLALSVRRQAAVRRLIDSGLDVIGLTFCEAYSEQKRLANLLGHQIYRLDYHRAVELGLTKPIEIFAVETDLDLAGVRLLSSGHYHPGDLDARLSDRGFNSAVARLVKEQCRDHACIAFVAGRTQTARLAGALEDVGIRAYAVTGKDSSRELDMKLKAYESGDVQVLVSADLLTAGYHNVDTTVVLDTAPTWSFNLASNRGGRLGGLIPECPQQPGYVFSFLHPDLRKRASQITFLDVLEGRVPQSPHHDSDSAGVSRQRRTISPKAARFPGLRITAGSDRVKEVIARYTTSASQELEPFRKTSHTLRQLHMERVRLVLSSPESWARASKLADFPKRSAEAKLIERTRAQMTDVISQAQSRDLSDEQIDALLANIAGKAVASLRCTSVRFCRVLAGIVDQGSENLKAVDESPTRHTVRLHEIEQRIVQLLDNELPVASLPLLEEVTRRISAEVENLEEMRQDHEVSVEEDSDQRRQRLQERIEERKLEIQNLAYLLFHEYAAQTSSWIGSLAFVTRVQSYLRKGLLRELTSDKFPLAGIRGVEDTTGLASDLFDFASLEEGMEKLRDRALEPPEDFDFQEELKLSATKARLMLTELRIQQGRVSPDSVEARAEVDRPFEAKGNLSDAFGLVLPTLSYREREIMKLLYGISGSSNAEGYQYTREEVGRIFKITPNRVAQVESKSIRKLQHPVRAIRLIKALADSAPDYNPYGPLFKRAYRLIALNPSESFVFEYGEDFAEVDGVHTSIFVQRLNEFFKWLGSDLDEVMSMIPGASGSPDSSRIARQRETLRAILKGQEPYMEITAREPKVDDGILWNCRDNFEQAVNFLHVVITDLVDMEEEVEGGDKLRLYQLARVLESALRRIEEFEPYVRVRVGSEVAA